MVQTNSQYCFAGDSVRPSHILNSDGLQHFSVVQAKSHEVHGNVGKNDEIK